jgi:succinate dehydrogenase hydrophobic anchor subunit
MRIRLNFWQTIFLFLPGIIGQTFLWFPHLDVAGYRANFAAANFLAVLNMTLVVSYQAYLTINFSKTLDDKSAPVKWNAYIPAVFTSAYLVYVAWGTFINPAYHNPHYNAGPLRRAQLHGSSIVILFFLLHAFITFYFINNQFVSRKIKLMQNDEKRVALTGDFLTPMRTLIKVSIYVIGCMILLTFIIDILTFAI